MQDLALKIRNYKCFGKNPQGFDNIFPINVIIGKNNSGKSSLLDLLDYVVNPQGKHLNQLSHKGEPPQVLIEAPLTETEIQKVLPPGSSGGGIGGDHWQYGQRWVGKTITVELMENGNTELVKLEPPMEERAKEYERKLGRVKSNPFDKKVFKRLRSERDLSPEEDYDGSVIENGSGATNIIQQFVNKASLQSELVEKTFLEELNKIVKPDVNFTDIVVQQLDDKKWEVYLEEKQKGRIALSHSGSGLKTILLVLVFIHLVPIRENIELDNYIFGFEEIENNLHPALQRRLFLYLKEIALSCDTHFFLTTHSNVVIDLFSRDQNAQILHVTHNGIEAKTNRVSAYLDRQGILDDLDVRASDLLQSNGVVWVEGPSDRLYFNRWIELWSNGSLCEGAHYQCVFYGGRLLAHLTAETTKEEQNALIHILTVNRNSIIIIDSDKKNKLQRLNDTKKRIKSEFSQIGAICWITKGKEIENYIPEDALLTYYKRKRKISLDPYQTFNQYLDRINRGEGEKYLSSKVLFAERIIPYLSVDSLQITLDLKQRLNEVCTCIKEWNSLFGEDDAN